MLSGKIKHELAWLIVFTGIFLLIGVQAFAAEIDLIQQAISAKRAKWVAKENPISRLPAEARKRLLGARSPDLDTGAPMMDPYAALPAIPATYDWRDVGGKNFVTPVRDQQTCGSCWAFGPVAALEAKSLITFNWPGRDLNLSEQIVLSCSGGGDCDGGGNASTASDYLKNTGTTVETCYPYTATDGACSNACPHWQSSAYKIASWQYVSLSGSGTAATIKNAIYHGGPVVAWFKVYTDFFSYSSGVYTQVSGDYEGGHFVLVTGYDDTLGAFSVKNSWNTTWGDAGYFKIAYSELTGPTIFGNFTYGYGNAINPNKANPWLLLMLD
ncbi:MAG: C1 family peptidase [Desulfobacterales bacterium]|nr:C1 family peptidase [Pseudomonadota bacterium]MBU4356515.1 C1 family peptidase [Pseudomonadota bacterium]MCG2770984.1 C1 family peptidase [Desulfobacterales bacterium]